MDVCGEMGENSQYTATLVCFILHVLCGQVACFQYYCHSFGADAQFGSGGAPLLCARNDYSNIIL